jgi:hypothetical protein
VTGRRLEAWLSERTPEVPKQFLPHLLAAGGEASADPEQLGQIARECLVRALSRPGRDRGAAFDLLTADAFLTYACEALTEEGDVGRGLETLIGQWGARFR